jgi:hypothetical protein
MFTSYTSDSFKEVIVWKSEIVNFI